MRHTGTKMIHVPFQGWGQSSPALACRIPAQPVSLEL